MIASADQPEPQPTKLTHSRAPLDVDREQVRMLVLSIGVREAARQMGLSENTVSAWSARFGWLEATRPQAPILPRPASMVPTSAASKSPADALADLNADLSKRSRTAALKYSAKTLEYAAEMDPQEGLLSAPLVVSATKVAATAGNWAEQGKSQQITLNILAMGRAEQVVEQNVIDVEQA